MNTMRKDIVSLKMNQLNLSEIQTYATKTFTQKISKFNTEELISELEKTQQQKLRKSEIQGEERLKTDEGLFVTCEKI